MGGRLGEFSVLEDLAIEFVNMDEGTLTGIGVGSAFLGFISALVVQSRSKSELQRAPYFAFSALLYLLTSALSFAWLFSPQAVTLGILWVLVFGVFLIIAVSGYGYGVIALARSRDAFGHGRYAILAFIPIASLVLLGKPSKNAMSLNRIPTIQLLSGGLGVLSGIAMFVASYVLSGWAETRLDAMVENAAPSIDFLLRTQGIDATLKAMADEARLPHMVDEVTTLAFVKAVGTRLQRTYIVSRDGMVMSTQFRTGLVQNFCAYELFIPLLRAGATFEEVYVNNDGSEIGSQVITRDICGF